MLQEKALECALGGNGASIDFSGSWSNELDSVVNFEQTGNSVTGTYDSAVSGGGTSTTGDLQGFVDGDLISFVVRWRDFQAIPAWVGQLNGTTNSITTLWQMTKKVPSGEEWASINAGTDLFTFVKK